MKYITKRVIGWLLMTPFLLTSVGVTGAFLVLVFVDVHSRLIMCVMLLLGFIGWMAFKGLDILLGINKEDWK